jgi:hypothetical protein
MGRKVKRYEGAFFAGTDRGFGVVRGPRAVLGRAGSGKYEAGGWNCAGRAGRGGRAHLRFRRQAEGGESGWQVMELR